MQIDLERMETLSPSRLAWRRALEDRSLDDLPYKIETNEYGQLVMSPTKAIHSRLAGRIATQLGKHPGESGEVLVEPGVFTPKGVKVPDVAWASDARLAELPEDAEAFEVAPEICVEVLSPSNTYAEVEEKRALYLTCGAEEFWTCDAAGRMRFFDATGELPRSKRAPGFPDSVPGRS